MKQLLFTKGPQGPIGVLPWTIICIYTLHNLTILLLDLEKKMFEICMVLALWGPPPGPPWGPHIRTTLNTPKDDSCHLLVKIQPCIFKKKMKQLLFTKGPQGPIGATLGTAMNNFCSSSNKVSTHYITWLFSFWIWRRRCLKFAWFWPFGALPLGPHGGHTYYLNNVESPTPKDDSCQVWLKSNHAFSRRRWKCKKFTDDARRTKTDGNSSLEPSAQVS